MKRWLGMVPFALRTPSRLVAVALTVFGLLMAFVSPAYRDGRTEDLHGPFAIALFLSGVSLVWIVGWWRRFWWGRPVQRTRQRITRHPTAPNDGSGRALPAAGWYPDPWGQAEVRWWDGLDWTGQMQGNSPTSPQA